ncbi:maestro heat-like repeat-containing protein family member 1 isoform X3 [Callithrix jacchus]|uniref:maestro heat-like repeat-containing protein family member 1 isoform X3 n=2 Tax=Callithrix jacchus TaxID=9483 RepID=UPI0023DD5C3F|nr:maestro heat-like repeat-containing protein family member 1 isoform X3 [Callithrix jacchus]
MTESYMKKLSSTLLDAITDKDPLVQEQVCSALCSLGEVRPVEMLRTCEEYLRQHDKLAHPYRAAVLRAMERVLSSRASELDKDTASTIILLASSEMTRMKGEVLPAGVFGSGPGRGLAAGSEWRPGGPGKAVHQQGDGGAAAQAAARGPATLRRAAHTRQPLSGQCFWCSSLPAIHPELPVACAGHGQAGHGAHGVLLCPSPLAGVIALQRFSEGALEYLANLDRAPDPTVRKDAFTTDIFSAYDVLFHHWLQSREAKLRLAVVEALGPMSHLLPSERLEEQLPKLLPGILALYKKHSETFYVSKSLGQILEAAVSVGSRTLDTQLDALLAALHSQICVPVESSSPLAMSNQKEALRCFTVLACNSPDRLLAFLLPRLDTNNERTRVGTLQVVRHVINSAAAQMEDKKPFILSSMRLPLLDTNSKVKRAVVQVISAMAHHGYLEQPGGEAMIEYIVQQCALPPEQEPEKPGPSSKDSKADSVRAISVRTLYLVSTTVDRMNHVLWPYLLQFLIPVRFTGALTPLCRSLMHLAQKRQEAGADTFLIQYDTHASLPSPYAVTARLLVVSSSPYLGDGRGVVALRLLSVLHPNIHPLLGQHWETTVPLLLGYLDEHMEETLPQEEWEERLLMFLRDTLAIVSDNVWICQLSLELCRQLPCYDGAPQEKNFLYKCIGTTLGAASSKEVVRKHLQELLETARYQEEAEREGLACCFGICAISHLEDTLAQLEDFVRSEVFRKSIGILNIFKDRSENEVEKVKSALILCYGHVAARAPCELVLAKVESDILRNVFQHFNTKDPALKLCLVQSVCMISHAICSSTQAGSFHFSRKAELVAQMMEFIRAEPLDSLRTPIRKKAMLTCTYLVSVEPALDKQAWADVIRGCLHSVMALLPEPKGEDGGCQESLYLDTLHALEDLLTSLLQQNMTPQGLQMMIEHLSPWIKSPRGHERARALGVSAHLLRYFLEHLRVSALVPFHNLGLLVGLFSPRCADLWPATRQEAMDCVHSLLYLQLGYEGFSQDYRDDVVERLLSLKDGLVHPDPAILFHTCHSVGQIIARRLPPDQLISLLLTMFEGLGDHDQNCSRAATVMINCLLQERGGALQEKVPEIVSVLRSKLQEVQGEHILPAAQHSIYLLATQHCAAVVSSLLGSPLPLDSHTCMLWRALAAEPHLATQVLGLLLEMMNRDVPFKESRAFLLGRTPDRVATLLPLSASCALFEVMSTPAVGPAVLELYPQLFVALLLRVSCTVGVQLPRNLQALERRGASPALATRNLEPCSSAVDTLRAVLLRSGSEDVAQRMDQEGGWELLRTSAGHEEGATRLARAMAEHAGPRLPLVLKALACTQSSVYEVQRVTTTAFLAELLNSNVANDLMLLDSLLESLAARQKDTCASVRRLVLRGLANLASGSPDKVRAHGPQLLTAMIGGLDDGDNPHSPVALEAMVGLAQLLHLMETWDLRSGLLHVAIRIRPFFDSEKTEFRTASIRLFGHLNKVCHGDCEDIFLDQVMGGMAPLLLHLQDPQTTVASACRFALLMCGPNLACEELSAAFQKHLQEGRALHFGEFLNTTCKHLMQHFPDLLGRLLSTCLFYCKSSWEGVRAAAPLLTGFLVLHAEPRQQPQVDLDQLISAFQILLKDPAPEVRTRAAEALGRLVKLA